MKFRKKIDESYIDKQKIILILIIFFVALLFFSSSYALLTNFDTTDDVINFRTGNLNMSVTNSENSLTLTELNGKIPESNESGLANSEPIILTLTNTGTVEIGGYDVKLVKDSNQISSLDEIYIKYAISLDNGVTYSIPDILKADNNIIYTGYNLDVLETKKIYLKLWIDESAGNNALNKTYYGSIKVDLYQKKDIPDIQTGIYITEVVYKSNIEADLNNSQILSTNGTTMNSKVVLSSSLSNSSITYTVTVYNDKGL